MLLQEIRWCSDPQSLYGASLLILDSTSSSSFLAPLLQKFSNDVPQWGFLFLPCPGLSSWKITPFPCENFSYTVRKLPNFPSSFSLFSLSGTIISQISLPGLIFKISDLFFPILCFYTFLPTLLAISLMLPFTVSVEGFISVLCCFSLALLHALSVFSRAFVCLFLFCPWWFLQAL